MAVAVTLELKCQSGKGGDMVGALKSMLGDTRARQGAVSIELVVKQDNSDHILVCEIWETKEDHQAYMGWRQERGDLGKSGCPGRHRRGGANSDILRHRRSRLIPDSSGSRVCPAGWRHAPPCR